MSSMLPSKVLTFARAFPAISVFDQRIQTVDNQGVHRYYYYHILLLFRIVSQNRCWSELLPIRQGDQASDFAIESWIMATFSLNWLSVASYRPRRHYHSIKERSILDTPAALGTLSPMTCGKPPLVVMYRLHRSEAIRPNLSAVGPTTELFEEPSVPVMIVCSPSGLTLVITLLGPATNALPC